tara:strand:+ start:902 stop:1777 length:876 start_codon:yes stop_codon:yes gene_type:complete
MNILIIDNFHHKNMIGINILCKELKLNYKFGNINDINNFDIIYSPCNPINTSIYPTKKFIFGPHFSLYPNEKLYEINNINKNSIYIQPSDWPIQFWENYKFYNDFQKSKLSIPFKSFPFPVEIDKFKPIENSEKNEVFIYFKRRKPEELLFIENFLNEQKINYKIFNYVKKYKEEEYLKCLQNAKFGIIVDAHESQGFAIEEALSCNVPLLVWNVKYMSQEEGANYKDIPCTNIPYWDKRCGEFFEEKENFIETYNKFINKIKTYKPRDYILENLSPKKCGENFIKLINNF